MRYLPRTIVTIPKIETAHTPDFDTLTLWVGVCMHSTCPEGRESSGDLTAEVWVAQQGDTLNSLQAVPGSGQYL